jgi:hypothetical protein
MKRTRERPCRPGAWTAIRARFRRALAGASVMVMGLANGWLAADPGGLDLLLRVDLRSG